MMTPGIVLQDRYRILRPLGRGGMGAVYEAADMRLSRHVALKETLFETDGLRRAFDREARLLANLRHPALPKVLDHFSEGTGLFLVMEFIPGDDLGVMLEQRGRPFAPEEVLGFADQLLDALEYLHRLDPPVLHRDIKPQNLKLISESHIVLLDFGLAKGSAGQMTRAGSESLLGYSPNYSPLEQMQGTGTDERSDLYSLGATLYHLLTNVKPADALTRATAIVNGQPDPLLPARELSREVSTPVSAALMRAMALNLDHRPRTASEMRADLHNKASHAASTVPMTDVDEITRVRLPASRAAINSRNEVHERGHRRQVVVQIPEETWVASAPGRSGRKWMIGVVLSVALIALATVFYLLFSGNQSRSPSHANRPVVRGTPPGTTATPSTSPTIVENINRQANTNEQEVISADELAARERLAQKNIPYSETAFAKVVEEGDTDAVDLFLAAGMSPDVKNATGRPALINAASRGSNHISQKLLSKGANVNIIDSAGSTALMESAQGDHRETTKVLLENGADVNLADNNGRTALIRAAARGNSEIVRMLINKGARIDVRDRDGRDALTWAEINNKSDVIDLLRKAGARRP
ncbi:MAG TPA: ankyrin repeat domain-containing protein [Pyrinomonadaceae bacterium]|jgi:serine/threonine protein kinase|nr:ankyrin repeat domain-containing protein [Pyrinomonadaceae bacterium]